MNTYHVNHKISYKEKGKCFTILKFVPQIKMAQFQKFISEMSVNGQFLKIQNFLLSTVILICMADCFSVVNHYLSYKSAY